MGRITELLDELTARDRPWGKKPVFNPPPSQADWDRLSLVFPGVEMPGEVFEYFGYGNGITKDPVSGRPGSLLNPWWTLPLPIQPLIAARVSFPAPCRLDRQLQLFESGASGLVLLLDGPCRGEVWSGHGVIFEVSRGGRVAWSIEHLLTQAVVVEQEVEGRFPDGVLLEDHGILPAGREVFTLGRDRRSMEERMADGGKADYYIKEFAPGYEEVTVVLLDREVEQVEQYLREWRAEYFPGQRKTPPPV